MDWSPQQQTAIALIAAWIRMRQSPVFYLAGYAGTGKTTLAKHVASLSKKQTRFAAFTGKAASVMAAKGCSNAKTIHSLLYHVDEDDDGEIQYIKRDRSEFSDVGLIVIDECSMVGDEMGNDLLNLNIPILVLGDPAQLPPVNGCGFFTNRSPDYTLDEIHRQAAGNPIIELATKIRTGTIDLSPVSSGALTIGTTRDIDKRQIIEASILITGRNDTRMRMNRWVRRDYGYSDFAPPNPGEPVICLKNDKKLRISNGEIFTIEEIRQAKAGVPAVSLKLLRDDGQPVGGDIRVAKTMFFDDVAWMKNQSLSRGVLSAFTFAYAITCHKSQGSQWPHVCVFEESNTFMKSRANWLYTAVTRASDKLTIVLKG